MDYVDIGLGVTSAIHAEIERYKERNARFLPIRITSDDKYALLGASGNNSILVLTEISGSERVVLESNPVEAKASLTVNDCVSICQTVLGLKINEIAKLVGVSRATLDLHRKGANIKDMSDYQRVYDFVDSVKTNFGDSIKNGLRNILINRKTLLQHFIASKHDLYKTYSYIEEVAAKLRNVEIAQTEMDESKVNLRLAGIGRMA